MPTPILEHFPVTDLAAELADERAKSVDNRRLYQWERWQLVGTYLETE